MVKKPASSYGSNNFIIILACALGIILISGLMLDSSKFGQKQITPPSQSNPTANWKIYNYDDFGYSFKLPASYVIAANQPAPNEKTMIQSISLSETDASQGPNDFIISVQPGDLNLSLQNLKQNGFTKSGTKNINNKEWTITTSPRETQYLTQIGNKIYTIEGRNIPLLGQILSTFKFTDQEYMVSGDLTKEASDKDIKALRLAVSKDVVSFVLLERFPLGFQIITKDKVSCGGVRKILSGYKFVDGFGDCQLRVTSINPGQPVSSE